ncbi:hypothetical protein K466DRAFT_602176 [Polyporus arcularius HHB13444]|uniref:Secreted protein n=1 Tax=Polyporus arcularius HHB13444 TaxID=1314778 RepID=A0A5C3PEE7_9APHY|nr:hypothetical protein K466DRAFT_602176 [Polyporus arcularius HHB13444]
MDRLLPLPLSLTVASVAVLSPAQSLVLDSSVDPLHAHQSSSCLHAVDALILAYFGLDQPVSPPVAEAQQLYFIPPHPDYSSESCTSAERAEPEVTRIRDV